MYVSKEIVTNIMSWTSYDLRCQMNSNLFIDHSHIIQVRPLFKVGYLMVKCVRAAINLISIDTSIFAKCKGQDFILTFFSACSLDHG